MNLIEIVLLAFASVSGVGAGALGVRERCRAKRVPPPPDLRPRVYVLRGTDEATNPVVLTLQYDIPAALNILAKTTDRDAQDAANRWAGLDGSYDLIGALNKKAGTKDLDLNAVCTKLLHDTPELESLPKTWDAQAALSLLAENFSSTSSIIRHIASANSSITVATATGPTATIETYTSPRVAGTAVTGTASAGKVLTGTGSAAAHWATPTTTSKVAMGGDISGTSTTATVTKVPHTAVVAGTHITSVNTGGKAKISATTHPTGSAGGGLTGTYPNPTVAKAPSSSVVAGTRISVSTTGGKAKITASVQTTSKVTMGGGVTGTSTACTVAKAPSASVVAGTRVTIATTSGKAKITASVQTATGSAGGGLTGTYPNPTVAKAPSASVVAGTRVTISTTSGKAKISANVQTTSKVTMGGDVTGTSTAASVVKIRGHAVKAGTPSAHNVYAWTTTTGFVATKPETLLVAGTHVTLATTGGKAKISASQPTKVTMGGGVTGTSTACTVAKAPSGSLVAGTVVVLATTSGKAKIAATGAVPTSTLAASSNTYTPARSSNYTVGNIHTPSANFTVTAPSGTAHDGDRLLIRIKSTATIRTPSWNSTYAASGTVSIPTTMVATKTVSVLFVYDSTKTKWVCMAATTKGY